MQHLPDKTLLLRTRRKQLGQQVSFIVVSVDAQSPPLILGSTFSHKVAGNASALLLQNRVGDSTACQHGLIVSMNTCGTLTGDAHHLKLASKARRHLQHCFIATNSAPNKLDLQLVCFFDSQQTGAQFRQTKNPVLDCLVTISAAWSASTFALIMNPCPRGSGMFGGSSSFPWMCPNSLCVQSFCSKADSSITRLLGSHTISAVWCFFKHAKTWNSWHKCPSLGRARWENNMEHSKQTSIRPSSTIHRSMPISDM
jgi:hypothetical protein